MHKTTVLCMNFKTSYYITVLINFNHWRIG